MNIDQHFSKFAKLSNRFYSNADNREIKKAWEFAKKAHLGHKRLSGESFVCHPLVVAKILVGWKLDKTTIVAALLHDTVEDGGATREQIEKQFGKDVRLLVDGVTKITNIRLAEDSKEEFVENLRKMIVVMAKDLRVVILKLADRLHNMRTLEFLPRESQVTNAKETIEIYAPLAERLGIGKIKSELEDLSFSYLYPEEFIDLKEKSFRYFKNAEQTIEIMKKNILSKLARRGIKAIIDTRKKGFYSLWWKLKRAEVGNDIAKVFDISAMRIITKETADCYTALGILHSAYKPVPSIGVSDFIAQPKPNGYRSIHTKVFGPQGKIVEVQIRTNEMHEEAEFGVAAHWAYAEKKSKGMSGQVLENQGVKVGSKLRWVKDLVSWQKEINDSEEFLDAVKFDSFHDRIFVFSPKGEAYDLPSGSTPVDFAYAVHTKLPNYLKCAKVNGKRVSLGHQLSSGDIVEIEKTKTTRKPSKDWLKFVKTTRAREQIRKTS